MAHNFALRARKLAWSFNDEKQAHGITQIQRAGTDSTLNDDDSVSISSSVRRLQTSEDVGRVLSVLKKDGCVIIEDFTSSKFLKAATEEVKPLLQDHKDSTPLIQQSPTVRNTFFANHLYQQLCEELLSVETTRWKADSLDTEIQSPILSSASIRKLHKVSFESDLARYDAALGINHEQVDKYRLGRDSMLGLIIPSSESVQVHTELGSHLWGSESPDFGKDLVEEELKVGQAMIVLGSLYHYVVAQSDRRASAAPCLMYALWSCAGVYRPEEQAALKISAAEVQTYPEVVQERLR